MDKEDILKNLGLTDKEARTYLAILELGQGTIKPIADKAGIKRTSIYNFIDRLVNLGLITHTEINNRMHYQAVTPDRLLQLQKENLTILESALPEFMGLFNFSTKRAKIHYYQGPEQMRQIVWEETRCIKETRYIWTGKDILDVIGGPKFMVEVDRQRIKNGIFIKTIRFREKEAPYTFSSAGTKNLRQLRYAPPGINIPMTMGIYDTGKVGFLSTKNEGFGILIESQEFMQTMLAFHQLLWEKSKEGKVGEG
jgi:sugar-specific transcriptional regulator TrmB